MALSLLLQGCSGGYAPVSEQSLGARREIRESAPASYRVQRGDTLYSISFRYGLDYREVARWNNIDSRYFIYPGQTLTLRAGGTTSRAATTAPPASSGASKAGGSGNRAGTSATGTATQPATATTTSRSSASVSTPTGTGAISWQWPHRGPLISRFGGGQPANKGVDIAGREGEPVKAAASGQVVYAGNGLLGYGNLVIINHNQRYLSAYAHNSRIFVREGDKVKAGEKIAEIGSTGTTRTMLHFEIRRDGNPVDPLRYLPK
jgi:lipoprotein NlpD